MCSGKCGKKTTAIFREFFCVLLFVSRRVYLKNSTLIPNIAISFMKLLPFPKTSLFMISTLKFPGCNLSIWSHTVRCCQQLFAPLSLGLLSPIFHDRNEWITILQLFLDVKRTKTKSPAKKLGKLCECVVNDTELRHRKKNRGTWELCLH